MRAQHRARSAGLGDGVSGAHRGCLIPVTLGQQLPLSGPQVPRVQKRVLEPVVSKVPASSDSPPRSAPGSVHFGGMVPVLLPSMHPSIY